MVKLAMAHLFKHLTKIRCHGSLIQRCATLSQYPFGGMNKKYYQSPIAPKYVSKRNLRQHDWLEKLKGNIESGEKKFEPSEKWIAELEEKFKTESNGNVLNFDLMLMTMLKTLHKTNMAILLMQYIRNRRKPSILVITEYMLALQIEHPKLVMFEYKRLKESLDLATVNINTLCSLAKVAARTCMWRDVYEMIDLLQKEVDLGEDRQVLEYGVATVLCGGIMTSNYELLLEMAHKHPRWYNRSLRKGMVTPALFEAWRKGNMHLDMVFELLHDMGRFLNLTEGQALRIQEYCKREMDDKVECVLTEVNEKTGICKHCSEQLPSTDLTAKEFDMLQEAVVERLVYGDNIYQSTTPTAYKNFNTFLQNKKYDVIFDGPNIYYSRDVEFWTTMVQLLDGLKKFLQKRNIKVLVVADNQRFKSFYDIPRNLAQSVEVYKVDYRISSDDIFMIFAAMMNGPDTYIVTNDNLRNHRSRLGDPCDKLFHIWQKRYQIMHDYKSCQYPAVYDSRTHITEVGWHVPYELDTRTITENKAYFKDTTKFVCVQKRRSFSSAQLRTYKKLKSEFQSTYKTPIDHSVM